MLISVFLDSHFAMKLLGFKISLKLVKYSSSLKNGTLHLKKLVLRLIFAFQTAEVESQKSLKKKKNSLRTPRTPQESPDDEEDTEVASTSKHRQSLEDDFRRNSAPSFDHGDNGGML